jgi:hypothetical protein
MLSIILSRKTGVVFNVTKSALGIIVNKRVGNRYIEKRINVRIDHVQPSKCQQDYLNRIKAYSRLRAEAKTSGSKELRLNYFLFTYYYRNCHSEAPAEDAFQCPRRVRRRLGTCETDCL